MKEALIIAMLAIALVTVSTTAWVVGAHYEAQAFNRATGSDVSTWEAMFIELRLQEGAQPRGESE